MTSFIPEGPEEQTYNVGTSGKGKVVIISGKGKVAIQGDDTENVEIWEALEDERTTVEPITGELATREALDATIIEIFDSEVTPPETVPGDVAGTKGIFSEATTVDVFLVETTTAEAT